MECNEGNERSVLALLLQGNLALAILRQRIESAQSNPELIKEYAKAALILRQPIYQSDAVKKIIPGLTYRQLNSWESNGLLKIDRVGSERGWRNISPYDLTQLLIIRELRLVGLALQDIKAVLKCLRLPLYKDDDSFVDSIALGMVETSLFGFPTKLVVTVDRVGAIVRDELFYTMLSSMTIPHTSFMLVDYSHLINKVIQSNTRLSRPFVYSTFDERVFKIAMEAEREDLSKSNRGGDRAGLEEAPTLKGLRSRDLRFVRPPNKMKKEISSGEIGEMIIDTLLPELNELRINGQRGRPVLKTY